MPNDPAIRHRDSKHPPLFALPRQEPPPSASGDSRGTCRDASSRALLLRYVVHAASASQCRRFESHLQACDECLDDVVAVWRLSSLLDEWGEQEGFCGVDLPELLRPGSGRRGLRSFATALLAALVATFASGLA